MVTLTLDEKAKNILDVFAGRDYREKLSNLANEAIMAKIKECNELIANFEAKYKMKFEEFRHAWESEEIKERHSHEVEADYIEWEALEMEKEKWLELLRSGGKS
ncbi:hypothetical protein [Candidatus Pyrohabitans sp.]